MPSRPPTDRYEPLPGLLGLPGFLLRKLSPRRRRAVIALGLTLTTVLVVAAIVGLPEVRRRQLEQARAENRAAAVTEAARRRRLSREIRPRMGRGPVAAGLRSSAALRARRALMARLEASVLADARVRLRSQGPFVSATCYAFPRERSRRAPQEEVARAKARLECLAVERALAPSKRSAGVLVGQPFRAQVNFTRGRYAWCKVEESPGEGLAGTQKPVALPPACGGRS